MRAFAAPALPWLNVEQFGAVGDGTTDDTAAINAALTAAAAQVTAAVEGLGPTVLFPPAAGYRTTAAITVPDGVNLNMQGPILYAGAAGATALTIGSGVNWRQPNHTLWVRRATLADWTDAADIGIRLVNFLYGRIYIREVRRFHTGLVCVGDAEGFAYNTVDLGLIWDNKVGVKLTDDNGGWCNENLFLNGEFAVTSTTHNTLDRVGVLITSEDGTYANNNGNLFLKPSFEIRGSGIAAEGTCVQVDHGTFNTFTDARIEGVDQVALKTANAAAYNQITTQRADTASSPTAQDSGTFASSVVRTRQTGLIANCDKLIYRVDNIHKRACYYDGATAVNVPGLVIGSSSTTWTDSRGLSGLTLNADYLEMTSSRVIGFYVTTAAVKRFAVLCDTDSGFGGRVRFRCFDAAGSVITTGTPVRQDGGGTPTFSTSYGGAWSTGSDTTRPVVFELGSTVARMFVMVGGGTSVLRVRSFALYGDGAVSGGVTVLLPWQDNGDNFGTAAPTAGTWEQGRRVWHAAPAAGGAPGWVCTTAGTPGTWRAMASLAA